MANRTKHCVGNIYSLQTDTGIAFFQCVALATKKTELDTIRVFEKVYPISCEISFSEIIKQSKYFFLKYPLAYIHKSLRAKHIGFCELEDNFTIPTCNRILIRDNNGKPYWQVWDGRKVYKKNKLSKKEKTYSPLTFWNDEMIANHLDAGFTLEKWGAEYFK